MRPEQDAGVFVTPTWCLICEDRPAEGFLRLVYVDTGMPIDAPGNRPKAVACAFHGRMFHGKPGQAVNGRDCDLEYVSFRERGRRRKKR